jgi:hypothetical protein
VNLEEPDLFDYIAILFLNSTEHNRWLPSAWSFALPRPAADAAELHRHDAAQGLLWRGTAPGRLSRGESVLRLRTLASAALAVSLLSSGSFSGGCSARCTYAENPAGVVSGGSITA